MTQSEITQKLVNFQKTLFDSTYNTLIIAQNNTEKMGDYLLEKSPWIPEKGKKMIMEYTQNLKKHRDSFKKNVDEYFNALF